MGYPWLIGSTKVDTDEISDVEDFYTFGVGFANLSGSRLRRHGLVDAFGNNRTTFANCWTPSSLTCQSTRWATKAGVKDTTPFVLNLGMANPHERIREDEPNAIRKAPSLTSKYSLTGKYPSKPLYFLLPPF
jgi:hypothetical protein